ncbi:MAG: hypothetical protein ACD_7C00126G0015 [uncultured bacterium]|nr:MAG: hypothetical protein ACD_7C00126G0015 [uncultured bacterium]
MRKQLGEFLAREAPRFFYKIHFTPYKFKRKMEVSKLLEKDSLSRTVLDKHYGNR